MPYEFIESDWKLFSSKYPMWYERYMDRLCAECRAVLDTDEKSSVKLTALQKKLHDELRNADVPVRNSRNMMFRNICHFLSNGVITLDDLCDFSEELQESIGG